MQRLHQPLPACRVVVLGGGAIGLAAGLVARLFGARDLLLGETNPLRRETVLAEGLAVYRPGHDEPPDDSIDLVIDAVGADATRATACRMVRPGGVIVHVGLLPGQGGLDIRKITLQEITLAGVYCYTPADFAQTVEALARGRLGALGWIEQRPLVEGSRAFADIDAGLVGAAKIILET